jgi:hypothetical protein
LSETAARITASCHSNGTERKRVHSLQYSSVRSWNSRAVAAIGAVSGSSGPKMRCSGASSTNGISSAT